MGESGKSPLGCASRGKLSSINGLAVMPVIASRSSPLAMSRIRSIADGRPALDTAPEPLARTAGRQSATLLLWLLVTAVVVQDIAWLVLLRSMGWRWAHWATVFAIGLALSQVGMAGVWLALARGPLWRRGLLLLAAIFFSGLLASQATTGYLVHWWIVTANYAAITAVPLAAARYAGVIISASDVPAADPRGRQFTIRAILILTTGVAVLFGIGRTLNFPWRQMGEIALFGLALGLIPWVLGLWYLRTDTRLWPVLGALVVCPIAALLIERTGFPPANQTAMLIAMTTVQGVLTLGIAAILRLAGLRLNLPR